MTFSSFTLLHNSTCSLKEILQLTIIDVQIEEQGYLKKILTYKCLNVTNREVDSLLKSDIYLKEKFHI